MQVLRQEKGGRSNLPERPVGCCAQIGPVPFFRRRRGVTLLELMLALALTSLVIIVIGVAIDFHLRTFDIKRADVEEPIVARAVLRLVAADLRNAVIYEPIDVSGVQQMAAETDVGSLDLGGGAEDDSGGAEGASGSEGSESVDDSLGLLGDDGTDLGLDESISMNTTDIEGTLEPTSVPGLFGNQYELQVDVSRLPRVDQYEAALAATAAGKMPDIVSDVKTVAYFLRTDESEQVSVGLADTATATGQGLVRRSMDRAVTSFSASSGTLDPSAGGGSLLAPEVNYLEFRYFDGLEWQVEWDSEEMEGLPVAVEITIGIDPTAGADPQTLDVTEINDMAMEDMNEYLYRLVVHLPVAQPVALDEGSLDSEGMGDLGL